MSKTIQEICNEAFDLNNNAEVKYIDEYRKALADSDYIMAYSYLNENPLLIGVWEPQTGHTLLIRSILEKNFQYASFLLQNYAQYGANIDQVGLRYNTALHFASEIGDLDLVKLLVTSGASINQQQLFGFTPTALATSSKHTNIVKYLIEEAKADLDIIDGEYLNILCSAARSNNPELVNWLITEKAQDVNFISEDFRDSIIRTKTALITATLANNFDMVKLLVENHGARLDIADQYGDNVIQNAIFSYNATNKEILEYLINRASPEILDNQNGNLRTVLMEAVENNDISLVTLLLNKGCNVNLIDDKGKTALNYSTNEAITKLLVDNGAIEYVEPFTDSEEEDEDESEFESDSDYEDTDIEDSDSNLILESFDDDVSMTGDLATDTGYSIYSN